MLAAKLRKTTKQDSEVIGVRIFAQDDREKDILRRFWDGGMKMNALHSDNEIEISFADLIETE